MEVLFYFCAFIFWLVFVKLVIDANLGWVGVFVHAIGFIIGAFLLGPLISKAEEIPKDQLGQFIATIPGIKYPEWGDKDITFPTNCEGSYRTRLNCARLAWDKHDKGN